RLGGRAAGSAGGRRGARRPYPARAGGTSARHAGGGGEARDGREPMSPARADAATEAPTLEGTRNARHGQQPAGPRLAPSYQTPGDAPLALRDRALLELAYASGLRVSELLGVTRDRLDLSARTVLVAGKGDKERAVPFGRAARQALLEYLERGRPALCARARH